MAYTTRLQACPSCACHLLGLPDVCPHCDAVLQRPGARRLLPTPVAMMMGLGAVALMPLACSNETTGAGGGGAGGSGQGGQGGFESTTNGTGGFGQGGGFEAAVSTYGVGTSTSVSSMSTAGSCSVDLGTDACSQCQEDFCCVPNEACAGDPLCSEFNACVAACSDEPCITTCEDDHPTGFQLSSAVSDCASVSCSQECS